MAKRILDRLEDLLTYPQTHRMPGLLLVGETNNGKTMIINRFKWVHPPDDNPEGETIHLPVLIVQAPPTPSEGRLYDNIMEKVACPFRHNDSPGRKQFQVVGESLLDRRQEAFAVLVLVRCSYHLTKSARKVSDQEIISTVNYAHKEGGQQPAPELNQFLSHHIIKRARRAGLFETKEKQHPGLCRYCQATQRQIKSGFSRHGTQQFRCRECGCIYQHDYETGRIRPSTIELSSEKNGRRIVSGGSLP